MCITKTTLTEASTAVINSPEDFTNEFPSHVVIFSEETDRSCTLLKFSLLNNCMKRLSPHLSELLYFFLPHPMDLMIARMELIRNLEYRFWNQGIVK